MTLSLVAGSANPALAHQVGAALTLEGRRSLVHRFADGELHARIEDSVRGHDVYLVQPTSPPVDEHLMEVAFLADACRRAGAARLTAVLPYFGYARQDRRASGREAIGATIVSRFMEAVGFARVVAVDLHAPEIEGFLRIPLEHLSAVNLLAGAIETSGTGVIVAPDLGAVKLAERYGALLDLPVAVLHKVRTSESEVSLRRIIGEVGGRAPIIVDDMISTGGTIEAAVNGLLAAGCAAEVTVAATHALFAGSAVDRLNALPIRQIVATDSVRPPSSLPARFEVVSIAPMLADVIARLHRDESLEQLLFRA